MKLLNVDIISSRRFTTTDKVMVAEASDLYGCNLNRQIYAFASVVGFAIVFSNNDEVVTFYRSKDILQDGEVIATVYLPISEDVRKNPLLRGVEVHILND